MLSILPGTDPFDPNNWIESEHECRIYGDDRASVWAIIDEVDYHWAVRWTWQSRASRSKHKLYIRRNTNVGGKPITIFLHKAVCQRAHGDPPTEAHTIADHRNGNSLDCRRANLRWVTPKQNRQNLFGAYPYDFLV